ncbi:MAG: TIGR00266 family protein [Myxococcales bacterium]|nr:TIGR00266 family protein [Myxococcales bacterium]MCB9523495.1 TIGR00266 family protein [Myxococcales bacterium]
MQFEIIDTPDFGLLRVQFEARDEQIVAESGAMVSMSAELQMTTSMRGGLFDAVKRKLLGGESLFQNTYTPTAPGQEILLAPAPEGDLVHMRIEPGQTLVLNSGSYLAHTGDLALDGKIAGLKSFFGGVGFFMLKVSGTGDLFINSYGALHAIEVGPEGYTVDNGHIVAFTEGLTYNVRKFGGFKGLFFSGEGLVTEFQGRGTVWVQTRNAGSLASFLEPYRRVQRRSSGD